MADSVTIRLPLPGDHHRVLTLSVAEAWDLLREIAEAIEPYVEEGEAT